MLRFLFDADHLTLYQHQHPQLMQRMVLQPPDAVGISAVTAEESLRGRLVSLSQAQNGPGVSRDTGSSWLRSTS